MNEVVKQRLRQMIQDHGRSVLRDPARCEALMADNLAEFAVDAGLLRTALKEGVPAELLDVRIPPPLQFNRLSERLANRQGVPAGTAKSVVEAWAYALSIAVPEQAGSASRSGGAVDPKRMLADFPPEYWEARKGAMARLGVGAVGPQAVRNAAVATTAASVAWLAATLSNISTSHSLPSDARAMFVVMALVIAALGFALIWGMYSFKSRVCTAILIVDGALLVIADALRLFSAQPGFAVVGLLFNVPAVWLCWLAWRYLSRGRT
jgi:hypothetical protein